MTHRLTTLALIVGLGLLVSACGGGGGDGGGDSNPPPPNSRPIASFTATPSTGTVPLTVQFDASASTDAGGSIAGYNWNFGDNSAASSGVTTSHVFQTAGTYTVTLTVTDNLGATGSTTRQVTASNIVVPNVVGQTQGAATTAIVGAGLTVGSVNTAASATVPAGNVISQSPAAGTLLSPGSAVNLVVSTGAGGGNLTPVASFTATPSSGAAPLTVQFDAAASSDPDGSIAAYSWNFGDGTAAASGVTVTHVFQTAGTRTVTLTVTDNIGATNSTTRQVTVSPPVDTTPNVFTFVDQINVPVSIEITSAPVTISGINAAAAVSVTGGTYSIGCGAIFTSATGTISNNQTVCVRHTSAATASTGTNTTLTVGGVADTFTSTTAAAAASFAVSGTITAASGSVIDSDVNDPNAAYAPNGSLATVQSIGNPATVGGYANQAGFGAPGRSQVAGDIEDGYRVTLAAGQVLTLTIGDAIAGDLDLYLFDEAGNLVASSEGVGVTETITVTTSGTYIIDVYAYSGATNYVLTIGQVVGTVSTPRLSVLADFVPGELIARFEPAKTGAQSIGMRLSAMGLQMTTSDSVATERPVLIRIDETILTATTTGAAPGVAAQKEVLPLGIAGNVELERKWRTLSAIKQLGKQPGVRYAEPNYILKPSAVPNDRLYNLQWHYPLINLPQAWDITTGSSGVIVAVIDTGVLLAHPDLQGQLISGYDFISDPAIARDGDGRDPNPNDVGDLCCGASSSFHGTHVAGTIAAATNNGIGVAGVAWNARIMPLRALGAGGGTNDDINQAILYAARLPNGSSTLPAQRASIINMSLGGPSFSQAQQDVVTQARNQGVIIIASAGNGAQQGNPISYPAAYTGVVSVGAVTIDKTRAPYSTFNAFVDIAAPGGDSSRDLNGDGYSDDVLSTLGDDSSGSVLFVYNRYQGTSMAAPHAAGVAALMKALNSGLTPAQFDALLSSGQLTQDLGAPGRDDQFGYGLVNAYAAVVAAQTTPTPVPARLVVTPSGLNFGTQGTNATLSLVNGGGGSLSVTSVSDDANWLTVGAASDPATGLGTRTVTVNRAGLVVGTYTASITIASTANTVTVPVIMQVSANNVGANVGFLYVLLLDPVTFATLYQTQLDSSNGVYQFSIPNVVAGSYIVLAGSDNNNDSFICDAAEACGGYPTLASYSPLAVSGNVTGVNFGAGFNAVLQAQSAGASGNRGYARFSGKRIRH
jgi:serine protease